MNIINKLIIRLTQNFINEAMIMKSATQKSLDRMLFQNYSYAKFDDDESEALKYWIEKDANVNSFDKGSPLLFGRPEFGVYHDHDMPYKISPGLTVYLLDNADININIRDKNQNHFLHILASLDFTTDISKVLDYYLRESDIEFMQLTNMVLLLFILL